MCQYSPGRAGNGSQGDKYAKVNRWMKLNFKKAKVYKKEASKLYVQGEKSGD